MLAMLPISRDVILWTKFAFAATASLVPCCALMLLSDLMLDIRLEILLAHQLSCAMLCLGLSAIAVGLGARLPDLHERSPSKIAAGFGGTLTLVISAIYIVAVVMLTAVPYHFRVMLERTSSDSFLGRMLPIIGDPLASRLGLLLTVILGSIAVVWPLQIGLKSFRRLDP
jgi:ABC-2 type transport system permease protein